MHELSYLEMSLGLCINLGVLHREGEDVPRVFLCPYWWSGGVISSQSFADTKNAGLTPQILEHWVEGNIQTTFQKWTG